MDKLKNTVSGRNRDEKSQSSDPISTGGNERVLGEGSHFGNSRTTGNNPLSSSTNPTTATQTGAHGLSEHHSSRMPGTFDDDAGDTTSHHQPHENVHDTVRSFPLGGHSTNTLGYSAPGQVGSYPAGGPITNLANKADPRADSGLDGSRVAGSNTGAGSSDAGPHLSSAANKVDPRAGSDLAGSHTVDSKGTDITASGLSSSITHGEKSWQHDHDTQVHTYTGDPCREEETSAPGPHFTSGPHVTDTANRLDPNIPRGTGNTQGSDSGNHYTRNTAPAGGANSAASVEPAEANRSDPISLHPKPANFGTLTTGPAPDTAGPHKSDLVNRADPRVDSDLSKQHRPQGAGAGPPAYVGGVTSSSEDSPGGTRHHHGRNVGLAGIGGVGGNEAETHQGTTPQNRPTGSGHQPAAASSSVPRDHLVGSGHQSNILADTSISHSSANRDQDVGRTRHTERDTALAGASAGGLTTHEYNDKHNKKLTETSRQPNTLAGASDLHSTTIRDHHATPNHQASKDHYARDAAYGAGVATLGSHEHDGQSRKFTDSTHHPSAKVTSGAYETSSLGPATGSGLESSANQASDAPSTISHGAGAGVVSSATHEYKDNDMRKSEKEDFKEAKRADHEAHKHEKKVTKADKKHEQQHGSDEKKPGLIDRIFHRHHDDKESTAAERSPLHDSDINSQPQSERAVEKNRAAGADIRQLEDRGAAGGNNDSLYGGEHSISREYEHGSSSGVHDYPTGSGHTTHEAYNSTEGQNKLHKDPPTKIAEQRGL